MAALIQVLYMSLVTIHGYHHEVFFVLTASLSGTFSNRLFRCNAGPRDMAAPLICCHIGSFSCQQWCFIFHLLTADSRRFPAGWTVYPPLSALPKAMSGFWAWNDFVAPFRLALFVGSFNGARLCLTTIMLIYTCKEVCTLSTPSAYYGLSELQLSWEFYAFRFFCSSYTFNVE